MNPARLWKNRRNYTLVAKNQFLERFSRLWRKVKAPALPKNPGGAIFINLGCGKISGPEFINVDALPLHNIHHIHDIRDLSFFPDNYADMIYASHVIEHIERHELKAVLQEWLRVLKPGGVLRFGVPNFDALIDVYLKNQRSIPSIENQLLGQQSPYDDHHSIWNEAYAEKFFRSVGFASVRPWDPATADHHPFKDTTVRSLAANGEKICISLNLEAIKPLS